MFKWKFDGDIGREISETNGFWLSSCPKEGHKEKTALAIGESTVYHYTDGKRGREYNVTRVE